MRTEELFHYQHGLIEVKEAITPKSSIDQDIAGFMQSSQTKLDQVIGHTETNLYRYRQLETTMDNYYSPY